MARKSSSNIPEWSRKILAFRQALKLTQSELGKRVRTSAMAISRWERGDSEPPAGAYIRLGNIAKDPLCWFFWGRAGLSTADVMRVLPTASRRLRQGRIAEVQIVHAGAGLAGSLRPQHFVAIPVLPVHAATSGEMTEEVADLDQIKPEALWAAPAEWCPNPSRTISLRVKGNSMSPLILDGYIIAVDTTDVPRARPCRADRCGMEYGREAPASFPADKIRSHGRSGVRSTRTELGFTGEWIFLAHHWQGPVVGGKTRIGSGTNSPTTDVQK